MMIHHPVILIPKLVVLAIIVIILMMLRTTLTPAEFRVAIVISIGSFAVFLLVFWTVIFRQLKDPNSRLSKIMVLTNKQPSDEGYRAASEEFEGMIGTCGKTISALRPTGVAMFGEKRVPVQTEGGFLPSGSEVEVVSIKGSRVFVRLMDSDSPTS